MDTKKIKEMVGELDALRERKSKIEVAISALGFAGHQEPLRVSIGGTSLEVTEMSRDTGYMSKVKRGYEMIHLGAKKVVQSALDDIEREIVKAECEIRKLTSGVSDE